MALFDINKYRQMFLEEAQDLFETIDTILLEAEELGDMDDETINSLFRSVHTLKGNSASVELSNFAALAHELEFFMDKLRNGQLSFEESMATLLIDGIDTLRDILELELADELEQEYFKTIKRELLYKLDNFSQDEKELELLTQSLETPKVEIEIAVDMGAGIDTDADADSKTDTDINTEIDSPSYGMFLPRDEDGAFGPIDHGISKAMDDGFGFFDDIQPLNPILDDEGFGFFEELESIRKTILDDDSFGFFDDNYEAKHVKPTAVALPPQEVLSKESESKKPSSSANNTNNSIRVDLSKIDALMNNIGELVIAHSMLTQYTFMMQDQKIKSDLSERLDLIDRYIRELQEGVMSVRMIPMETVFSKFPKVIRDTAKKLNKKIDFRHYGDSVEIDKAMIEGLTDPLTHIVRNAMDHGIESIDKRRAVGKSEVGILQMSAEQANGQMIIKIQDDGGGINLQKVTAKAIQNGIIEEAQASQMSNDDKAMLIFAPGLSTAEAVTDISGRGVGMDVVMSNIKKLGGVVKVESEEGFGSTFTIVLPLTLAIVDGLNIRVGKEQFILPLSAIIETLKPEQEMIKQIGDKESEMLMLRNEFIPIVRLHTTFNITPQNYKLFDGLLIVVRSGAKKIALFVDEFMNQQQFVIKPLDKNFRNAQGIGGATVRGDGTIGLIIDTMNIA